MFGDDESDHHLSKAWWGPRVAILYENIILFFFLFLSGSEPITPIALGSWNFDQSGNCPVERKVSESKLFPARREIPLIVSDFATPKNRKLEENQLKS